MSVLLLLALCVPAQDGTIKGNVKNIEGGGAEGVTVEVTLSGVTGVQRSRDTTIDLHGDFVFDGLKAGDYTYVFKSTEFIVQLPSGSTKCPQSAPIQAEARRKVFNKTAAKAVGDRMAGEAREAREPGPFYEAAWAKLREFELRPSALAVVAHTLRAANPEHEKHFKPFEAYARVDVALLEKMETQFQSWAGNAEALPDAKEFQEKMPFGVTVDVMTFALKDRAFITTGLEKRYDALQKGWGRSYVDAVNSVIRKKAAIDKLQKEKLEKGEFEK